MKWFENIFVFLPIVGFIILPVIFSILKKKQKKAESRKQKKAKPKILGPPNPQPQLIVKKAQDSTPSALDLSPMQTGPVKNPKSYAKINNLPPLKRAILWSEILGNPVGIFPEDRNR